MSLRNRLACLAALLAFDTALLALGGAAVALGAVVPLPAAAAQAWGGVPVLMYHKVDREVPSDAVGRDLTVSPDGFAAQLQWLRTHGIHTVTAAQLTEDLARGQRPERTVVLSFDDGYADAATTVLPILRRYGATATFYVSAGFVGTPRHLNWRQLRELRAAGMEVACHGTFHLDLSTLDRAGQQAEAGHCLATFAKYLGGPRPFTYAYPAGKYDAVTFQVMRELGIRAAFTEIPGAVKSLEAPFVLPRRRVRRDDSLASFAALAKP